MPVGCYEGLSCHFRGFCPRTSVRPPQEIGLAVRRRGNEEVELLGMCAYGGYWNTLERRGRRFGIQRPLFTDWAGSVGEEGERLRFENVSFWLIHLCCLLPLSQDLQFKFRGENESERLR